MSQHDPNRSSAAEIAYAGYVAQSQRQPCVDFETFCGRHGDLAPELRRLHALRAKADGFAATVEVPRLHDVARAQAPIPLEVKTPRYRLEGEIARGGMGAVLKVWDNDLRRALAMKVILGESERSIDDGSTAEIRMSRFLEEAQITGQLDHPGVVPVHELGVDQGGRVYFTMRLVKGSNFGEVIGKVRSGADGWNMTRALGVLQRVCETMAYAHSKGVVHRDLKPENVMVGQFGETYAMDWGLARLLGQPDAEAQRRRLLAASAASIVHTDRHDRDASSDAATRTQAGVVMGTPCYMPPEQAAGELESIGPQSDIYSLGAILYHLLTGKRPYEQVAGGSVLGVVRAVLEGPPLAIHLLDKKVPLELIAICERAMARVSEDRYASMVDMAADVRAFLEGRVVQAYQQGAFAEFMKWVRRNRGFSAAIAGLVVVAITGLAALAWTQSERAAAIAAEQDRTRVARDEAIVNLDQARQQGYIANVTAASASLAAGETVEGKLHLTNCFPELRGWEWHHLSLAADASVAVLDGRAGAISGLCFDTGGLKLVVSVTNGALRIWDLASRRETRVFAGDAGGDRSLQAPAVAFVDGDRNVAAFGRNRDARVRTWDAATGELRSQLALAAGALYAVAVSAKGDRAALGASDHAIHVVDPRTGDALGTLVGHRDTVRALAFSADGTRLVSGSEDRTVRIWNVGERAAVGAPIATSSTVYAVAFSTGNPTAGAQVAAGLEDGSICRFEAADGTPLEPLSGHRGAVFGLAFDADGARLASASFDKTVRVWNMADGSPLAVLVGHEQPVYFVQFNPAGTGLASGSADGTVRLWDVERNRASVVHRGPDEYLAAVDITADGPRVVIGSSWPGTLEVLDAETGRRELQVRGPEDSITAVAFSPDGRRFAAAFQEESSLRLCDLAAGSLGEPMLGHEASVTSLAFCGNGATLASGSADRTVRLWDVEHRTPIGKPLLHEQAVSAVAVTADGEQLAVGTLDGAMRCTRRVQGSPCAQRRARRGPGGRGSTSGCATAGRRDGTARE